MSQVSDPIVAAYQWQQDRRIPDTSGIPIEGFGAPAGIMMPITLWLPPAKIDTRIVFENGKPKVVTVHPERDAELYDIRRRLLLDITHPSEGLLSVGIVFLEYAASLIRQNYKVNDQELSELLTPGPWQQPLVEHAVGGDDFLNSIQSIAPQLVSMYEMAARMPAFTPPAPIPDDGTKAHSFSSMLRGLLRI